MAPSDTPTKPKKRRRVPTSLSLDDLRAQTAPVTGQEIVVYEPPTIPDPEIVDKLPVAYPVAPRPTKKTPDSGVRPSAGGSGSWNRDTAALIVQRLSLGETVTRILQTDGMPSQFVWNAWCLAVPELRELYFAARVMQAHALFDEALGIARDIYRDRASNREVAVSSARLAVETFKWAAGKLSPRDYGDKADTGPLIAIKIVTDLDLGYEQVRVEGETLDTEADNNIYVVKAAIPTPRTPLTEGISRAEGNEDSGPTKGYQKLGGKRGMGGPRVQRAKAVKRAEKASEAIDSDQGEFGG